MKLFLALKAPFCLVNRLLAFIKMLKISSIRKQCTFTALRVGGNEFSLVVTCWERAYILAL